MKFESANRIRFNAVATLFLGVFGLVALSTSPAGATTSSRTWVASTGSDSNTCTRTKPCATFAKALTETAPGGEVDSVDAADYGPLNITFAVTIDGGPDGGHIGSVAHTNACNVLTAAICVSTGSTSAPVVLRNLSVNVAGSFVYVISSGPVYMEKLNLEGVTVQTTSSHVVIKDSETHDGGGVYITGPQNSLLQNVTITGQGIICESGQNLGLQQVTIMNPNGYAIYNNGCLDLHVDSSLITNSAVGIYSSNGVVSISNSTITYNQEGLSQGDIVSFGNNRIIWNGTSAPPAATSLQ